MLTPERLAAMKADNEDRRRLRASATQGEWRWSTANSMRMLGIEDGRPDCVIRGQVDRDGIPDVAVSDGDMQFMEHAANHPGTDDIDALIAEIERLNAVVAKYEADGAEYRELALKWERKCGSLVAALEDYNHAVELVVYRDSIDQAKAPLADAKEAT